MPPFIVDVTSRPPPTSSTLDNWHDAIEMARRTMGTLAMVRDATNRLIAGGVAAVDLRQVWYLASCTSLKF